MSTQRAAPGLALNPHGEERRRRVSNREAPAAPDSRRARLNVSPRPYAIISRGASRPSFRIRFALITKEGAGKAGRRPRPWPACSKKSRRQSPQVWPGTPGLPRATVGTAYTWSPWCTGLVGHHARRRACARSPRDTSIGVSGPHDFAVRNEPFVGATQSHAAIPCAHRIPPPTSRDGRDTPLHRKQDGIDIRQCWKKEKKKNSVNRKLIGWVRHTLSVRRVAGDRARAFIALVFGCLRNRK
jgi:hypothetical protein